MYFCSCLVCIVVSFLVCIVVSCLVCIVIVILFLELQGMLLMKNCISRRLDVISLGLLYIGVNCASFVWTSGHICVDKWSYLCGQVVIFVWTSGHICVDKWSYLFGEVVIFGSQDVRKCGNISLWGRWTKL